jgi:uncharacterized repeat protein (TIGR01451 family)
MNLRPACLLGLALLAGPAVAQCPPGACAIAPPPVPAHPPHPPATRGPSPLLYVRFSGAPGLRVTFYQGRQPPRTYDAPAVVGVRPGYTYRVQLGNLPNHPGVSLFPTLEVYGSLHLGPKHNAGQFPLPLPLTEMDIASALAGNLVTKVIYLEDPDRAIPTATQPGELLETQVLHERDLMREARARGRPIAIYRLGGRVPTLDELTGLNVPGTILLPGERVVPPAALRPCLPIWCGPAEEECLRDGGDRGERVGYDAQGRLRGLDPEDAVGEYTDCHGRRRIVCSTRVCICVPRFAAMRYETPLGRYDTVVAVVDARGLKRQEQVEKRTPSIEALLYERLKGFRGRLRPGINEALVASGQLVGLKVLRAEHIDLGVVELLGTKEVKTLTEVQKVELRKCLALTRELSATKHALENVQVVGTGISARYTAGPEVVRATATTRDLTVCCNECPCPPDKPLVLVKCADRSCAKVGDVITFSLRYSNHGGKPMTDVAVTDSLSGRLEYVPDSAQTDREAVFTIQENEAGSVILRWEIGGVLQPGETGRIRFKVKVR